MASDILCTIRNRASDLISILLIVLSLGFALSFDSFGTDPSSQNNPNYEDATEISTANHLDDELAVQFSLLASTTTASFHISDENPPFHSVIVSPSFIIASLHAELSNQAIKRARFSDILNQLHHHFFFF